MGHHPKNRFWRVCRVYFRRFRIAVWLLLLTLVGCLLYLNQVGLPGFIKTPLLERLRARGVDLQFSRLRLRWYEGIVAENVRFGRPDEPLGPRLTVKQVRVQLNSVALQHFQVQVDALVLSEGRLAWPVPDTNIPGRELAVEKIHTELRLLPNDEWALNNFSANFAGARFLLGGVITHASAIQHWSFLKSSDRSLSAAIWQTRLRELADQLDRVHFSASPEITLNVRGDATDLQTFAVHMIVSAPGARTPWADFDCGRFDARLFPATTNKVLSHAELRLEAAAARTRWASVTNLQLSVYLASVEHQTNLVHGELTLRGSNAQTKWAAAGETLLNAQWVHAITNPVPLTGHAEVTFSAPETKWASARRLQLAGTFSNFARTNTAFVSTELAWWTNLQPYDVAWQCDVEQLESAKIRAETVICSGSWSTPRLLVTNLDASLYGAELHARASLDVVSRKAAATLESNLDPFRVAPAFGESVPQWLQECTWEEPPQVRGAVSLTLPAWTNSRPDWRAEVQPSLCLEGHIQLAKGGSYRLLTVTGASAHLTYSNLVWHVPELHITRPEGELRAEQRLDDRTKEFYCRLRSTLDPRAIRPLLNTNNQKVFELITLTQPPALKAEVWGRLQDPDSIGFNAHVSLTNFAWRAQSATSLDARIQYSNRVLQVFHPVVERGTQHIEADGLLADFNSELVYLTNGFSTAEPMVVITAINPDLASTIAPYEFLQPPVAHVYGTIPTRGEAAADLHFELAGGPFHWWKFHLPHISGHVHWRGESLTLTNISADFYQGKAAGNARFDFKPEQPADFRFAVTFSNVRLRDLMNDLSPGTNHLEGRLNGNLTVTKATTGDWRSVFGYGDANLQDGLIWEIPIFGVFSPVLDAIVPGLGKSRASAGTGTFAITNGVIRSEDLEIRATGVRLQYRGTVDLETRVNARVEAMLLRDMWLVGPVVSTVFWPVTKMFEYRVTGSLYSPQLDPIFIVPKIVLIPFRPFSFLKSLFEEPPRTNPPPAKP
jgi:hypothetical protein